MSEQKKYRLLSASHLLTVLLNRRQENAIYPTTDDVIDHFAARRLDFIF